MAAANPEKRAQVRRLVEVDGLSMTEAARRVGAGERSVIRWQAQDAAAGDPWVLKGEASRAAKERNDVLTDEERQRRTERARRAALAWSEERRRDEAAAAGVLAAQLRNQIQNALPRYAASLLEGGETDTAGARSQRIAAGIKSVGILYAVALTKADELAGFGKGGLTVEAEPADLEGDAASATVALLAEIRERRASA